MFPNKVPHIHRRDVTNWNTHNLYLSSMLLLYVTSDNMYTLPSHTHLAVESSTVDQGTGQDSGGYTQSTPPSADLLSTCRHVNTPEGHMTSHDPHTLE